MDVRLRICVFLLVVSHQNDAGSKFKMEKFKHQKFKNQIIIVVPPEPYYPPPFIVPPPYIVWEDEVFDDIIPFDPNFYEPCPAPDCSSPIIDHADPQEKEDEDYEKLHKNISKPALELFKSTWTDPCAERPTGREHSYELQYLDMVNEISMEKSGIKPYHPIYGQFGQFGGQFGGHFGGHFGRYRRSTRFRRSAIAKAAAVVAKTPTVRKEYRTMTPAERVRFHKAVRALKESGAYDTIGKRHKIADAPGAHEGAAFLLFHRIYILQLEVALQLIDPGVFLPYWDSSLDSRLGRRYRETCLFDSHSLGQWKGGPVTDGAFANFTAYKGCEASGKILTRKVGSNTLYTSGDFNLYDSYRYFWELAGDSWFEDDHGYIHVAVGGHLSNLNCAPVDPIFFMHHAFVDYLWWRFRNTQKGNITTEYVPWAAKHHKLNDTMKPFEHMKNKDGLKVFPMTTYEESPSMKRCKSNAKCKSDMLWCDRGRCTSKVRVGTWCHRKNPSSCFCEGHGVPSCAGMKKWRRRLMKCVCTDPKNPTNAGNTATPAKKVRNTRRRGRNGKTRRTGRPVNPTTG